MPDLYYKLARLLFYSYLRLRNGLRFYGIENVPEGPVVLACNHASYLDPVIVSIALPSLSRRVRWMAWDVLFRIPVLGFLIGRVGAFPVKPDKADRCSFKVALDILSKEGVVGIFPEGGRTPDGEYRGAKPGFVRIARHSKAAIVPVIIRGAFKAWPVDRLLPGPGKISVYFLPPINDSGTEYDRDYERGLVRAYDNIQKNWRKTKASYLSEGSAIRF